MLYDRQLSVSDSEKLTGVPDADLSRIRNVKPDCFTVDKLMTMQTVTERLK